MEPRSPAEGMPATIKSWNTTSLSSNTKESSTPMGTATVPNNSHCQSHLFQLTEILTTILIPPSVERECPATSQPITTTCLQSTLCGNPHRNDLKARLHPHLTHAESACTPEKINYIRIIRSSISLHLRPDPKKKNQNYEFNPKEKLNISNRKVWNKRVSRPGMQTCCLSDDIPILEFQKKIFPSLTLESNGPSLGYPKSQKWRRIERSELRGIRKKNLIT
jgi:hypothetical protein